VVVGLAEEEEEEEETLGGETAREKERKNATARPKEGGRRN